MYFYKKSSNIASLSYLMYILPMEKDMKNLTKSVELIANTTAKILERVDSIENKVSGLENKVSGIESKLNSFKLETRESFEEVNTKLDNLNDTDMNFDKRIEKIEDKVLI